MNKLIFITILFTCSYLLSCKSGTESSNRIPEKNLTQQANITATIIFPNGKKTFSIGEKINLDLKLSDSLSIDSIVLSVNNIKTATFKKIPIEWDSKDCQTGSNNLRFTVFADTVRIFTSTTIQFLASKSPEMLTYKVVNTYPHDPKAYTQGLFFEDGYLYESTGQYGQSTLRKVELKTGKVLQQVDLPASDFGEGIVKLNNHIYQLTWEKRKGYVYNFETFQLLYEFPYSTEGWGIETDGEHLIISNGTNRLYYLHPESFTEYKILDVYDHKGQVTRLNELEYYDNKIWANVYGEDYIITICPKTGQVLEMIDFEGILSKHDRQKYNVDVLNGIAWDKVNNRLFVTGKNWPKLFEVVIVKK